MRCRSCEADFPPDDYTFTKPSKNYTGLHKAVTDGVGTGLSPWDCHCHYAHFEGYGDDGGGSMDVHQCFKCIEGMTCYSGGDDYEDKVSGLKDSTIGLEPGYWRPFPTSLQVFECEHEDSCLGTNATGANYGDGLCQLGHTGPYCEVCVHNKTHDYAKDSETGECIRCDPERLAAAMQVVGALGILFLAIFSYAAYKSAKSVQSQAEAMDPNMTDEERELAALKKIRDAKAEMAKMKGEMAGEERRGARRRVVMARVFREVRRDDAA